MAELESLERKIIRAESALIALSILAVAGGDYYLGPEISLGYLYLIPLSYSALTHRWLVTLGLIGLCVALRQWFGPLQHSPWEMIVRDWVLTAVFAGVVTTLHRLGTARHEFFEQARRQRDELLAEVRLAAKVQTKLLEQRRPPVGNWDITAQAFPLKTVGGDYYDFLQLRDGSVGIVIADVAGKGLPAAMLMPAVQIALRALAGRYSGADEILHQLNQTLYEAIDPAGYATMLFCALDFNSGRLRFANAGHQPGLLLRTSGRVDRLLSGGTPVGLLERADYEVGETEIDPGETLVLFTDGLSEVTRPDGEEFGERALEGELIKVRQDSAQQIIDHLRRAAEEFHGEGEAEDDVTIIVVKAPPRPVR